jgi:hypothetical protein
MGVTKKELKNKNSGLINFNFTHPTHFTNFTHHSYTYNKYNAFWRGLALQLIPCSYYEYEKDEKEQGNKQLKGGYEK